MKRIWIISLLCYLSFNQIFAQLTNSQSNYLEKKIMEAVEADAAAKKKAQKEKARTEQRHQQIQVQHQQQFNRQMNNLNQYSAEDFLSAPQPLPQSSAQPSNNNNLNKTANPVATAKSTAQGKTQKSNATSGERNNFGTPSYSGNDYTGDRYNLRRNGLTSETQKQQQPRMATSVYKAKYTPKKNGGKASQVLLRGQNKPARTNFKNQAGQGTRNNQFRQNQNQQVRPQQVQFQVRPNTQPQAQQSQLVNAQKQFSRVNAGNIVINPSKSKPNTQTDQSSPDLKPVDITKPNATIKYYKIASEAKHLNDTDNKLTTSQAAKTKRIEGKTTQQLHQEYVKDVHSGMSSFDNRKKWEKIYNYELDRKVNLPSRTAVKKRK